jgi:hypothetical protein
MQLYTVYYISVDCSICFGWLFHPSSGAHVTVITVSGTGQTLITTAHLGKNKSGFGVFII